MRVYETLGDLESDLRRNAATFTPLAARVVRGEAERGNREARRLAQRSAGKHGKHYPNAFSAEPITPLIWEYGPDADMPQGDMSFEYGSRNQPPHLDLAKSADTLGPRFPVELQRRVVDRMFW